jgi:hypothetical protein
MKLFKHLFVIMTIVFVSSLAQASKYVCKETANGVCAVNKATGQCTHAWSDADGEDPMFFCQKFIGEVKSHYNPANYKCVKTATGACAKSISTGQCTHSWSDEDGGNAMFFCKKHLGLVAPVVIAGKYTCKKTANGYCAKNLKTGQCTHEWSNKDGDALFRCQKYIGQ